MDNPVGDFKTWYRSLPLFARTFMAGSFIIACLASLKILSIYYSAFIIDEIIYRLQIWRVFTSFVAQGPFSFNYIFNAYFAYFAISRVETDLFGRDNYADFLWLVSYLWLVLVIVAIILELPLLSTPFVFAMLYIWCKKRPFETITFYFGLQVKSGYFPYVYMGFNVLMGGSIFNYIIGLALGHLYIFVKDILKVQQRKDYLATPKFFTNFVNKYILGRQERAAPAARVGPQIFGGRGVQIG